MPYFSYTTILLILAVIITFAAQIKVSSAYKKYRAVSNRRGESGAQAARKILDSYGLSYVGIQMTRGKLSDHYSRKDRMVYLSEEVYAGSSLAAVGIAAHEVGHAIQHSTKYFPLSFKSVITPVASISSRLSWILITIGFLLFYAPNGYLGLILIDIGILMYAAVLLFQTVTLPVEFNASKRARDCLISCGVIYGDELSGVRKMLSAAAFTYVAAMAATLLNLLRVILIRGRR